MKILLSYRRFFRILSVSTILFLIFSDIYFARVAFDPGTAMSEMLSGYLVLILVPPSNIDPKRPFFVVSSMMALSALIPVKYRVFVDMSILLAAVASVNMLLVSDVKTLAPSRIVWNFVQNESRCLSAIIWMCLATAYSCMMLSGSVMGMLELIFICTTLFVLRYLKDYHDIPYALKSTDAEMMHLLAMNKVDDDKAAMLFQKIERMMEESHLYLDAGLSQSHVARAVLSNTSYVSKVVNHFSGKNFKNYVSSYRVRHAAELIDSDSRLKMSEVAQMSGFNSVPTFNHMFKDHMGVTPTEYKYRDRQAPR